MCTLANAREYYTCVCVCVCVCAAELFKWFVSYVEKCEKICGNAKISADLKEFLHYMTQMFEEVYEGAQCACLFLF